VRPGILCLGAAIAFLSGAQTAIPVWADRMCVGWLLRIISSPKRYLPRYIDALKLVPVLYRHREKLPQ
jgi:UDP-N-acetyl-D-mannosaminuronic acid transferase (WecB/TagA/CpsF family)